MKREHFGFGCQGCSGTEGFWAWGPSGHVDRPLCRESLRVSGTGHPGQALSGSQVEVKRLCRVGEHSGGCMRSGPL